MSLLLICQPKPVLCPAPFRNNAQLVIARPQRPISTSSAVSTLQRSPLDASAYFSAPVPRKISGQATVGIKQIDAHINLHWSLPHASCCVSSHSQQLAKFFGGGGGGGWEAIRKESGQLCLAPAPPPALSQSYPSLPTCLVSPNHN